MSIGGSESGCVCTSAHVSAQAGMDAHAVGPAACDGLPIEFCIGTCSDMCLDMCSGMYADICADICVDMCAGMYADICANMCVDMCAEMRANMYADMGSGTCADMRAEIHAGMCSGVCSGMCAGMRADMRADMCTDMCSDMCVAQACPHTALIWQGAARGSTVSQSSRPSLAAPPPSPHLERLFFKKSMGSAVARPDGLGVFARAACAIVPNRALQRQRRHRRRPPSSQGFYLYFLFLRLATGTVCRGAGLMVGKND